jgi:tetratricopeptide (TPR) repeat protein
MPVVEVRRPVERIELAAAIALVMLVAGCSGEPSQRTGRDRVSPYGPLAAELAAAAGDLRPTEGRLATEIGHAPFAAAESTAAGPTLRGGPQDSGLDARVRRALATERSAALLGTLALRLLLAGRPESALEALDEALGLTPNDPALWSDSAAAWLARPAPWGDPEAPARALEAATRACELAPGHPAARFNRAVALERLGLRLQATSAWREYRAVDPGSAWAEEARRRAASIAVPEPQADWRQMLEEVERAAAAGDATAVDGWVAGRRQETRKHAERRLLGDWATALDAGRTVDADRALTLARAIGDALARLGGDRSIAGAAAAIDAAQRAGDGDRLEQLVQGHLAYRRGWELARGYQIERAEAAFAEAERRLADAGSPFAAWAAGEGAVCAYQDYRYPEALSRLAAVRDAASAAGFPALIGRAEWVRGLALISSGRPSAGLEAYRRGAEAFERAGETGNALYLHGLAGEGLCYLGDRRAGWREIAVSLGGLERFADLRQQQAILEIAAADLAAAGRPRAALDLEDEVLTRLGPDGEPTDLAFARLRRARLQRRLGRARAAAADLERAAAAAGGIEPGVTAELIAIELAVSRADLTVATDPAAAEAGLSTAIEFFNRGDKPFALGQLLTARARVRDELGDAAGAEADLKAAIATLERQRPEIDETERRGLFFAGAGEIAGRLIELLTRRPGREDEALTVAEAVRARSLFDLASSVPGDRVAARRAPARAPMPVAEVRRRLPEDRALVVYSVLAERSLAWVLRRDGPVAMVPLAVGKAELTERVAALRESIRRRAPAEEVKAAGADLHRAVLGPLRSLLLPGEPLVLVPDGPLAAAPFAALADPATGRFLIEDRELTVAPSAALYAAARERAASRRGDGPPVRALVIGDPAFDPAAFELPRLSGSGTEGVAVAALYSRSELLTGERATRRAFAELAGSAEVVHLATHAVLAARARDSYLLLAPEPGTRDPADSVLTAADALDLTLGADPVVVLAKRIHRRRPARAYRLPQMRSMRVPR